MDIYAKMTTLRILIINNDIKHIKKIIDKGADVNYQDEDSYTALIYAAVWGRLEIVKFLVEKGADVNYQDKSGRTALIWAAEHGHLETVKFLAEQGVDVNIQTEDGNTVRMITSICEGVKILSLSFDIM